jgi:hypothetical protein
VQYVGSRPWYDIPPTLKASRQEEKAMDFLGVISETMENMMNVLITERNVSEESEAITQKLLNYDAVFDLLFSFFELAISRYHNF